MKGESAVAAAPDLSGLSGNGRRLLLLLGRFGFLTRGQAAAWLSHSSQWTDVARAELERRGWITRRTSVYGRDTGPRVVLALTAPGRAALRGAAERPVRNHGARWPQLDQCLAAVDLALELERGGAGTWLTWSAYRAASQGPGRMRLPPAGVLRGPDGTRTPVWVVLGRTEPQYVRTAVRTLYRRPELEPGRIFAPATLKPWLDGLGTHAAVTPWEPPHLQGRPPLGPGWCSGLDLPRGAAAGAGSGAAAPPLLGPRMLDILGLLDRFGYATCPQVAAYSGIRVPAARASMMNLERRGLAQRWREAVTVRRGEAWSATAEGLRTVGSLRRPLAVRPLHRRHSLALVDLALELRAAGAGLWETERELGGEAGPRSSPDRITPPDGRLTEADGRRVLIQLQLTPGHIVEQYRNAWRQRHRGLGDTVRFVCTPDVAPAYRRAIQPAEADFIEVVEWAPPDHSGWVRDVDPGWEARRRKARERRAGEGETGDGGSARER